MNDFNILLTTRFKKEIKRLLKKYPSLEKEFSELVSQLEKNHQIGTTLANNCYKIRLAIASKGKGKSGGARIITYLYCLEATVYLLTIYDKSEIPNINDKEINKMVEELDL